MTNSPETLRVVREVDHPAIRMQLDIGSLIINNEEISVLLPQCASLIGHVHVSEPGLVPIGDCETDHAKMANFLNIYLPNHLATIEMLATKAEPHCTSIARSLDLCTFNYRKERLL